MLSSQPTSSPTPAVASAPTRDGRSPILEIKDLHTYFFLERGVVKAVNGVNLTLDRQSTLGVVGESGCGKSVTAMSVMRLIRYPPGRIVQGEILLHRKKAFRCVAQYETARQGLGGDATGYWLL